MPSQRFKGFTVLKGLEGLKGFKGLEGLERLEGFEGLRAGKRQTWTPIRSIDVWPWGACWLQEGWQTADLDAHKKPLMCGLGVAVGCRVKHAKSTF